MPLDIGSGRSLMLTLSQRVAREWLRKKTPTQMAVDDLNLLVSDERFERAMAMAAKYMGGRYQNGVIRLPYKFQDKSFPTELTVLYRKMPCGFITNQDDGTPCVTFDLIPKVSGDPRRSKVYKSFPSSVKNSKVAFGKFLNWLRVVGDTVRQYVAQEQSVRLASAKAVSQAWLKSKVTSSVHQGALLQAPPKMLKDLNRKIDRLCYGHIWAQTNKHIEGFLSDDKKMTRQEEDTLVSLRQIQRICAQHAVKPKAYKAKAQFRVPVDFSGSRYEKALRGATEPMLGMLKHGISVVLDFKGHAKRGGQWHPSLRELQVDVNELNRIWTVEKLNQRIEQIHITVRHELQHVAQTYMKLILDLSENAGLPSSSIRSPDADPSGFPTKPGVSGPKDKRIPHHQRDVEFYTNLTDDIDTFERELRQIPKPYWGIAARIYVGLGSRQMIDELEYELKERYKKTVRASQSGRFLAFKQENAAKWKKAVKEFWKAMQSRGVNLDQGYTNPLSLDKVLNNLYTWRRENLSFGYDKGQHYRTKDGWVVDIYQIENWDERAQPNWESKPGKERWEVLVTPEGRLKQLKGPSPLPSLPSSIRMARDLKADLMPPLGHPGGTCKVVKRIVDEIENPRLESQLVNEVQRGNPLSNPAAQKVYAPEKERGAWKFKLLLTPHAQYRMDLRGITVPEVRAALDHFFRDMNADRSRGNSTLYDKFMTQQPMESHDKRTNTFFAFVKRNNDVVVITTYKPGESDPRSDFCHVA